MKSIGEKTSDNLAETLLKGTVDFLFEGDVPSQLHEPGFRHPRSVLQRSHHAICDFCLRLIDREDYPAVKAL